MGSITIKSTGYDSNKNKVPVSWTRNILIDPSQNTITPVSFFGLPYINVTPEIYGLTHYSTGSYVLGTGSFYSVAVYPKNNYNGDYSDQFAQTTYQIFLKAGTPFSSSMQGEKIRLNNVSVKSFTYTNQTGNNLTYVGALNTDFVATIKQVINDSTLLLDVPFSTVADVVKVINQDSEYAKNNLVEMEAYTPNDNPAKQSVSYKKNFYVLSLDNGQFEVIYNSVSRPTATAIGISQGGA